MQLPSLREEARSTVGLYTFGNAVPHTNPRVSNAWVQGRTPIPGFETTHAFRGEARLGRPLCANLRGQHAADTYYGQPSPSFECLDPD
jgi:hypothetical protein